jgi:hypothetical protein
MNPTVEHAPNATPPDAPSNPEGEPRDFSTLAARIREAVSLHGWAHVEERLTEAEFEVSSQCLGTIELRTDLIVDPELERRQRALRYENSPGRPALGEAAGMDFHTDRPNVDVLAWYCVEQDAEDGSNLLIDTRDLSEHFSEEELSGLGRIAVGYGKRNAAGYEDHYAAPLVAHGPAGWRVFYVPWQVRPPLDEGGKALLARFVHYIGEKATGDLLRIRLERGQCLFIDNHRMLHGRGPLPPDSRRHLVRLYLRVAGAPC